MFIRRCLRFGVGVPRLLRNSSVQPGASVPPGRSFESNHDNTHLYHEKLLLRRFTSGPPNTDVTYDQLKKLLVGGTTVVIDVREPWELREYGYIPGSINVPLGQVGTALQLSSEEFKEKYGGEMPQPADSIVFSCLAGIRSKKALETVAPLGYKHAQHFPGGWQEWFKNEHQK